MRVHGCCAPRSLRICAVNIDLCDQEMKASSECDAKAGESADLVIALRGFPANSLRGCELEVTNFGSSAES